MQFRLYRRYNEITECIHTLPYANQKRTEIRVCVTIGISFITKLSIRILYRQEITEIRTRTASNRPYNEITEGIRALWKAET